MSWDLLPHAYNVRVRLEAHGPWEDALAWGVNPDTAEIQVTMGRRVLHAGDRPTHARLRTVSPPYWIADGEPIPGLDVEQG